MEKKLRQVTDTIHGSIYLSELESELISTPYFYRLHDIYQSSTVYMTFPSNRTKRYEHSLGTMALASKMLFSSVTNAQDDVKEKLFKELKNCFIEIASLVINGNIEIKKYINQAEDGLDGLFDALGLKNARGILAKVNEAMKINQLHDSALDFFQYYPKETKTQSPENVFFYRCILQSIRIVALFHDVGHPPYSHIIENVLEEIYREVDNNKEIEWNEDKVKDFKECLTPFFVKNPPEGMELRRLFYSNSSESIDAPHERIGLSFLDYALDDVVPSEIKRIIQSSDVDVIKISNIMYLLTVVGFVFAILTEKNTFFKSIHKIVDGIIDADRLDYIVRDSQNSGVDWGRIPYGRIINSAKLFYLEKDNNGNTLEENQRPFIIAYPKKIAEDIEDLLLVRYKIYARINYHHRCMKTSIALQTAIRELTIDYLTNEDSDCINKDISILWEALGTKVGNKKMRVIQWNDSWLISVLHKSLIRLTIDNKNNILKESLEEILLNKKRYISLIKRGNDNCEFVKLILQNAKITEAQLNSLLEEEYKKYYTSLSDNDSTNILIDPKSKAIDSILRIINLFSTLDLESLCRFIPLKGDEIEDLIYTELNTQKQLINSVVVINKGKEKNGLPKHNDIFDAIYIYENDTVVLYAEDFSLRQQIQSIEKSIPWLYVYFIPKDKGANVNELKNEIFTALAKVIGEKLRARMDELFDEKLK